MKKIFWISLSLTSFFSTAQVLVDSIVQVGPYNIGNFYPASEGQPLNIYTTHINFQDRKPVLLQFDDKLNLKDTIKGIDAGRPGAWFTDPFVFNGKLYYICRDSLNAPQVRLSFHELKNGDFIDSIGLDLDTIAGSYLLLANEVDNNTLEVHISSSSGVNQSHNILHLDSNFNFKNYYIPKLDSVPPTWANKRIRSIHYLNDSIWHIFLSGQLVVYNINRDTVVAVKNIISKVDNTYTLANNTYLALGLALSPAASNVARCLGFYRIDHQANTLDTVRFNAFQQPNNYSHENTVSALRSNIVYDSLNIILAGDGDHSEIWSSERYEYFYVVKTDWKGTLKWQFIWGGLNNWTGFTGIAPTDDMGCVITGSIRRLNSESAILIKLGPDGTISNVELDAPENLVQFYPNPIKNKLSYNYLPEANGTYSLEMVNMNGQLVRHAQLENAEHSIPVELQSGFYLYHLKDESGKVVQVGKLEVE